MQDGRNAIIDNLVHMQIFNRRVDKIDRNTYRIIE